MILFVNVFITNSGQGLRYDRGLLGPAQDRFAVFQYSMASFGVIPWSKVVIYFDLADPLKPRADELEAFLRTVFREPEIHRYQNERQEQWQTAVRALEAIDDDLVWFCCNDDHVFVDYETGLLIRVEAACRELLRHGPFVSMVPTHWPEYLAGLGGASTITGDFFAAPGQVTNSMQVISKALLRHWWFEHDYEGAWMPRTDAGMLVNSGTGRAARRTSVTPPPPYPVVVPFRELVRHYDGYSHAAVDIDACPPLSIPAGFFEDDIRVAYCAELPDSRAVLVNPLKPRHSVVDSLGADLRCCLEDLPLFWRSRISDVRVAETFPADVLCRARNEAVVNMATWCHPVPVERLATALRFADDDMADREVGRLAEFLSRLRQRQHHERIAQLQTAEAITEAQAFRRWREERAAGLAMANITGAGTAKPHGGNADSDAQHQRNTHYLKATHQSRTAAAFDPENRGAVACSLVRQFARGRLTAGAGGSAAVWSVTLNGETDQAIFLHPPAKLHFDIPDCRGGLLTFGVAIHPDARRVAAAGKPMFRVTIDGCQSFCVAADSTWTTPGAGWWNVTLPVPSSRQGGHVVVIETESADGNLNHCWAVWREPVLWLFAEES